MGVFTVVRVITNAYFAPISFLQFPVVSQFEC